MNKNLVAFIVAPIFIGMAFVDKAPANSISTEEFLGEYQGVSVKDPGKNWLPADLNVSIQPHDNGFIMRWVTVTSGISGITERQKNTVKFHPTKRTNVFAAAMKPNLLGGWEPLDPFNGDPFMWPRYLDPTLTVYTMTITDSVAHDMQIYERTLTPGGLSIKFQRLRNESPLQVVIGILKRKK